MKVVVSYVHPAVEIARYQPLARRFAETYVAHPPGSYPHDIWVLVNGFKYPALDRLFSPLPVQYMVHNNTGKDLGAFAKAAETIPCDLLVCLGAPVHFHRAGWLDWIVEAYLKHGPALYGAWAFHVPAVHIRTTAFWFPPQLLNAYPHPVSNATRYEMEHGNTSLTLWSQRMGYPTLQVTWDGVYDTPNWCHVPRDRALMWDQHVERNQ